MSSILILGHQLQRLVTRTSKVNPLTSPTPKRWERELPNLIPFMGCKLDLTRQWPNWVEPSCSLTIGSPILTLSTVWLYAALRLEPMQDSKRSPNQALNDHGSLTLKSLKIAHQCYLHSSLVIKTTDHPLQYAISKLLHRYQLHTNIFSVPVK